MTKTVPHSVIMSLKAPNKWIPSLLQEYPWNTFRDLLGATLRTAGLESIKTQARKESLICHSVKTAVDGTMYVCKSLNCNTTTSIALEILDSFTGLDYNYGQDFFSRVSLNQRYHSNIAHKFHEFISHNINLTYTFTILWNWHVIAHKHTMDRFVPLSRSRLCVALKCFYIMCIACTTDAIQSCWVQ